MSALTDNDLKELKDLITSKFESISKDLNDIKVDAATIKSDVNGLGKRLDDTNKRIDNLEFTNRGIFITVISGLLLAVITLTVKFLTPPIS
ncbi:hypothetical protein VKI22_00980 [Cyanobacterium aponinum UTEX 3221]|uniref:hypothetical protein n=1 Tax=Cyanobacterium aponinum TaxID=379064 RepID=UPI002B4C0B74|nr:hypothetical protein [Cyanobacterium aponinum]WRL38700.1 hypothetical protein VKI22_00980 [Cyanobacterium aponinum UTEX 3221]